MRRFLLYVSVVALMACSSSISPVSQPSAVVSPVVSASASLTPVTAATPTLAQICHGLAHVYNPDRLHVLASCVGVRGVIISARQEPDGDLHVLLKVDADQRDPRGGRFTNSVNAAKQGGDLVLEPVCVGPVIQPDAVGACAGYHNPLTIPPPGTHVVVTGPWVLDAPHGWLEIHPLERVEVLA